MTDRSAIRPARPAASRRAVLAGGVAAAGALTLGFPAIVRAQTRTIVTTLFGGIYEQNYRKAVLDPFTARTGARFVIRYGAANEWLTNAIANKDNPEIDLPFLSLPVAMRAITLPDLFLDLTPQMIPNLRDIDPFFYDAYNRKAVGFNYVENGVAYRTDKVSQPPVSWKGLWEPRFRGQLLLPDLSGGYLYELVVIAAQLHGGSETNLEPGFAALKALAPHVYRWFRSPNEAMNLLQRAEASVASIGSSRAYALKDGGTPVEFTVPREGAPVGILSFHVPQKARNRDLLLEFVNWALSKEAQTAFGNAMVSGMSNRTVQLDPPVAARVVPLDKLLRLNWQEIAPRMSQIADRMRRDVFTQR
ncbi:MAG: ABC transporter substrate-binding protein [Alphaproteobacteria bacterium]|nr:ABC transporter substrate-binding protein [Alphaproteobacteria bacterium]